MHRLRKTILTYPWLAATIATTIFILVILVIALYADRQVVDYRTDPTAITTLGIDSISPGRTFARYDTNHYLSIVEGGYHSETTAFFPLYPMLAAGITAISVPASIALQIISLVFTFGAVVVLFYWLRFELRRLKSTVSPWYILLLIALFPTSLYLTIGYTESLFIFLTITSLYAYRTKHYILASITIAFASATRVQGGALAVFFLLDYLMAKQWKDWKKLIPVMAAPIGLVIYMIYLYLHFGNPLEFIEAQKHWGRLSGNIIENLVSSLTPPYLWYLPVLGVMLYAVKRFLGNTWFIYSLIFILIPLSSGRLDSLNRYMLSLPPLFLAFGIWLRTKPSWIQQAYWFSSVFLLAWNIIFFFNNYWVA